MKIAVGLSGGVDSAVAALLLKRDGHEVVGVTMKLWREGRYRGGPRDACFGPGEVADIAVAEKLAERLGIGYRVFDCSEAYETWVVERFRRERAAGHTPNPCVVCNRHLKFGLLPELAARAVDADWFATGHYARIVNRDGRLAVARAADRRKDQSYFLWDLSQEQLARVLFPLGTFTKTEVRAIAREAGLPMADKPDSQDFYSGDEQELLSLPEREGRIVSLSGETLGRHSGYWRYTVGQRRGLGVGGGEPFYVVRVDACRNEVVVGRRDEAVRTTFPVRSVRWMATEPTTGPIEGRVKIRSTGEAVTRAVWGKGVCRVPDGIFGVAPGQSAVLYDAETDVILCGGVIDDDGKDEGDDDDQISG